jgi:hypothetical protein
MLSNEISGREVAVKTEGEGTSTRNKNGKEGESEAARKNG